MRKEQSILPDFLPPRKRVKWYVKFHKRRDDLEAQRRAYDPSYYERQILLKARAERREDKRSQEYD